MFLVEYMPATTRFRFDPPSPPSSYPRSPLHATLVFLHVLAAIVWIGGSLFLALVGAPVLRRLGSWFARLTAFAALVVLVAAVHLARGG